jgi:hypothetical protein
MKVLEKDIIPLTKALDLQPEDFPRVPHPKFNLHPHHQQKRVEEFHKLNEGRIALLERGLNQIQTELQKIKSPEKEPPG